jgi:hypothetical protein
MSEPKVDQLPHEEAPIASEIATSDGENIPSISTWRLAFVTTGILLTYLTVGF